MLFTEALEIFSLTYLQDHRQITDYQHQSDIPETDKLEFTTKVSSVALYAAFKDIAFLPV